MLWTVAFVPGALALGAVLLGHRGRSGFAWLCIGAAAGVLLAGFVFTDFMPAGLAQRIAFGVWFLWLAMSARHAL
jgi:hypothetical protein